jgi:hypothetical protein
MNGQASSGFKGVVLSSKWQLLVSYGFILAAGGWWPRISLHPLRSVADACSTKLFKERKIS